MKLLKKDIQATKVDALVAQQCADCTASANQGNFLSDRNIW